MFVEKTDVENQIPSFEASEVIDEETENPGVLIRVLEGDYKGVQFLVSAQDDEYMKYSVVNAPEDVDLPQPFADSLCQMMIFKITEGYPENLH